MRIKRKTRIAVTIEERLLVRSRQSGESAAETPGPPTGTLPDRLSSSLLSKFKTQKDPTSCNEE